MIQICMLRAILCESKRRSVIVGVSVLFFPLLMHVCIPLNSLSIADLVVACKGPMGFGWSTPQCLHSKWVVLALSFTKNSDDKYMIQ